jgi:hypothetical protein
MEVSMSGTIERASRATAYTSNAPIDSRAATDEELAFSGTKKSSDWNAAIDKLLELRGLEDDWDGEGASAPGVPVADSAIRYACALRHSLASPDRVAASVNGSICFEWRNANELMELEICPEGTWLREIRANSVSTAQLIKFQ